MTDERERELMARIKDLRDAATAGLNFIKWYQKLYGPGEWDGRHRRAIERLLEVKTMEIIGMDGKVHYRRPEGDPLIQEALSRGLTIREQKSVKRGDGK